MSSPHFKSELQDGESVWGHNFIESSLLIELPLAYGLAHAEEEGTAVYRQQGYIPGRTA